MATEWQPLKPGEVAIAHLSDLHIGSKNCDRVWDLLQECLTTQVQPGLLLVSGDLVHSPSIKQLRRARVRLENFVRFQGVRYFVCAGNHDRHFWGNRFRPKLLFTNAWTSLPLVGVPLLALTKSLWWGWATGSSSATTATPVTETESLPTDWSALRIALLVLPILVWLGAGAWSWFLKRQRWLFDDVFKGRIPDATRPDLCEIEKDGVKWKIGLFGLDSSNDADFLARGIVSEDKFKGLVDAATGDFDLCVVLVHHHLQSVRRLEERRKENLSDLLNVTALVNSGSVLEALAKAHIDLVLHGHEHSPHWASYKSFESGRGVVRVIGAGSATGNDSAKGCSADHATFNVIVLSPNREARLRRLEYQTPSWMVVDEIKLFDSSDLRQAYLHRTSIRRSGPILGEISKYFEFTRERDILVKWSLRNWISPGNGFSEDVSHSTGKLEDVVVRLIDERGVPTLVENCQTHRREDRDNTWTISWRVPVGFEDSPLTVEIGYRWRGGGLLTWQDLENNESQGRTLGPFRVEQVEYASIWTSEPVKSAELIVSIPPEFEPKTPPDVRVHDGHGPLHNEANELRNRVRNLGRGLYSLRIEYPRVGHKYRLIWEPRSEDFSHGTPDAPLTKSEDFLKSVRVPATAERVLAAFKRKIDRVPGFAGATFSLYVADSPKAVATCISYVGLQQIENGDSVPTLSQPPHRIPLIGDRSPVAMAFWGSVVINNRPQDRDDLADLLGFLQHEIALCCVPVRCGFDWINPAPWCVIRIGLNTKLNLVRDVERGALEKELAIAALHSALAVWPLPAALAEGQNDAHNPPHEV